MSGAKKKGHTKDDSLTTTDPVYELKLKIEEAKAAKDFKLAQTLREQLWTLRDTAVLGPGVSAAVQPSILNKTSQTQQSTNTITTTITEPSLSDENPAAKSLQKLEKKLKSIQELKKKKSKGIKLEANQRAKIGAEDEIRKEIELLKGILDEST